MNIKDLKLKSNKLRKDILKLIYIAQSGHPWWSLSAIDILTVLYYEFLKTFPKDPYNEQRDYFILSKGHASPALYSVLWDLWFFDQEDLFRFRQTDALLQGHPTRHIPWIEVSTWSLGQWLSVAIWIALWIKLKNQNNQVWAMLWDWELQEWQVWEAIMSWAHHNLGNLKVIIDNNWLQIDGPTQNIKNLGSIKTKFDAFWWQTLEVDGHDIENICKIFKEALSINNRPCCIIARTIKWKWVDFMEWKHWWHGKAPNEEEYQKAISKLIWED